MFTLYQTVKYCVSIVETDAVKCEREKCSVAFQGPKSWVSATENLKDDDWTN